MSRTTLLALGAAVLLAGATPVGAQSRDREARAERRARVDRLEERLAGRELRADRRELRADQRELRADRRHDARERRRRPARPTRPSRGPGLSR